MRVRIPLAALTIMRVSPNGRAAGLQPADARSNRVACFENLASTAVGLMRRDWYANDKMITQHRQCGQGGFVQNYGAVAKRARRLVCTQVFRVRFPAAPLTIYRDKGCGGRPALEAGSVGSNPASLI